MQRAGHEVQFHAALGIFMRDGKDFAADLRLDAEFLAQLAAEAVLQRLTQLALAPGEFPQPLQVHAALASAYEIRAVTFDPGRSDNEGHVLSLSGLKGYARHWGHI